MADHVTYLSGEDAREFRRAMAFTNITHRLVAEMAHASDPEIWQNGDIIDRLRSLKRAKDALKALIAFPQHASIVRRARALAQPEEL